METRGREDGAEKAGIEEAYCVGFMIRGSGGRDGCDCECTTHYALGIHNCSQCRSCLFTMEKLEMPRGNRSEWSQLIGVSLLKLRLSTVQWLRSWWCLLECNVRGTRLRELRLGCWTKCTSLLCSYCWMREGLGIWEHCVGINYVTFIAATLRHCWVGMSDVWRDERVASSTLSMRPSDVLCTQAPEHHAPPSGAQIGPDLRGGTCTPPCQKRPRAYRKNRRAGTSSLCTPPSETPVRKRAARGRG
jgi:hypothetical protein